MEAGPRRTSAGELGHAKREEAERHVTPEKTVAPTLVDIQAPASGDHERVTIAKAVVQPLEVALPAPVLVQFVEDDQWRFGGVARKLVLEERWVLRQGLAVQGDIPVEIAASPFRQEGFGQGRLAHLARP